MTFTDSSEDRETGNKSTTADFLKKKYRPLICTINSFFFLINSEQKKKIWLLYFIYSTCQMITYRNSSWTDKTKLLGQIWEEERDSSHLLLGSAAVNESLQKIQVSRLSNICVHIIKIMIRFIVGESNFISNQTLAVKSINSISIYLSPWGNWRLVQWEHG